MAEGLAAAPSRCSLSVLGQSGVEFAGLAVQHSDAVGQGEPAAPFRLADESPTVIVRYGPVLVAVDDRGLSRVRQAAPSSAQIKLGYMCSVMSV